MATVCKGSVLLFLRNISGKLQGRLLKNFGEVSSYSAVNISTSPRLYLYDETHRRSIEKPDEFWAAAAEQLEWNKKWDSVLDDSNSPFTKWFSGAEINVCHNALDRHVAGGRGGQTAVIYDSPVTGTVQKITFQDLLKEVELCAGVLKKHGVSKGDRVLIYMPMIPQALVAMLASARIGAIHSLVFGGFAAKELATRIKHAEPKVILSANVGIEPGRTVPYKPMLDEALDIVGNASTKCVIYNRHGYARAPMKANRDSDYSEEIASSQPADCVPVLATDPLYVLYTSGTTGVPKAVVRPCGGYAVVLHWSMYDVYGMAPGEVWWAASDLGWVVGHSYINYAPLLHGNTTILFEGKPVSTPDPGTYFRVLKEHNVAAMFVTPTALRAVRREDPNVEYGKQYLPLDNLRMLFVAGEHCDHETMEWTQDIIHKPVLDNWWQTETGWPMTCTCVGLGMQLYPPAGVTGKPVPGWDVKVVDSNCKETEPRELGQIVVKLPLPPGAFSTLYNNDERFRETYYQKFPGFYDTMDSGYRDENGYIAVMSRTDDVINVAGHRLSTAALEEAILEVGDVAESAVVGVADELKGEVPLGLVVLKHGVDIPNNIIIGEVIRAVRDYVGPVAAFKKAVIVPKLPKTRSGKVARNTLKAMAESKPYRIPVTIEDATVYPIIREALQEIGFAKESSEQKS